MKTLLLIVMVNIFLMGCSSFLKTDVPLDDFKKNNEFEQMVKVKKSPPKESASKESTSKKQAELRPTVPKKKKPTLKAKGRKKVIKKPKTKIAKIIKHLPKLEDAVGFNGRRPINDPFRIGEKTEISLTYLNMTAGKFTLSVLPMVEVNGAQAYQFQVKLVSSKVFAWFYKLNNIAETYVDYEQMIPFTHEVHINESKQIKEAKSFYDWKSLKGNYWEKRITDDGETNKKKTWKLKPFSQNLISALFYLRTFTIELGKEYKFRVADAGKSIILKGKVLKREKVKTQAGEFDTYKVKIEYEVDGTFEKEGDVYFWLTADERKFLVKLESKIKIGSLVGEASHLVK